MRTVKITFKKVTQQNEGVTLTFCESQNKNRCCCWSFDLDSPQLIKLLSYAGAPDIASLLDKEVIAINEGCILKGFRHPTEDAYFYI